MKSTDDIRDYLIDDDEDDDADDDQQSEDNQSTDDYSQSSRIKLITNSEIKIAIKSTTNNNNCSGDYYFLI